LIQEKSSEKRIFNRKTYDPLEKTRFIMW